MAIVGKFKVKDLVSLVGEELEIHCSDNPSNKKGKPKRHPLNVKNPILGCVFFQSEKGQAFLRDRAAGVKTDPVKADPVKTDPVKADPVKTDPVKVDPVKTDPVKAKNWLDDL